MVSVYGTAQQYADKTYYLVDSLELEKLSDGDKQLIEEGLKAYHSATDDTSKVNALTNICENMMDQSWEKYQFFQYDIITTALKKTPTAAEEKSLKTALSHAVNNIGVIHVLAGRLGEGLNYIEESLALKMELGDKAAIAGALNNFGVFYYGQGDVKLALEYYERSLAVMSEINDHKGIATAYEGIGIVHKEQGDLDLALSYFKKALDINVKLENQEGIAQMYNNIGVLHKMNEEYDLALENFLQSLKIREASLDKRGMAESLSNLGHLQQEQGDLEAANNYFLQSFELRKEINDVWGLVFSYNDVGEIYFKQGNLKAAEKMGKSGLELSQSINAAKTIQRNALLLSLVYEAQGRGLEALAMNRLSEQMKDSLYNESTQRASIRQQTKYEFDKAMAIRELEHENKLSNEKKEKDKQKLISYGTAIVLGLVALFLAIVFNRLKVTRTQKEIIERTNTQLTQKNKEVSDSITYAKRIQNAILPSEKLIKTHLKDAFVLYKPKDVVAGDFYWMEQKGNNTLFAAADCTGHGVPGAMVSVVCHNALNRAVREYDLNDPADILNKTREIVMQEFGKSEEDVRDGMDIALCNMNGTHLQYAGAHNPLWIVRNGEMIEIKANKQPVGKFRAAQAFESHQVELQEGDTIYVFSDGYTDQFGGEKGKKFKTKAFRELLLSLQGLSMKQQKEKINNTFEAWRGNLEQIDDVCVIGVRI